MIKDQREHIRNNLSAFNFSTLRNLNSLLKHLQNTGISHSDFFEWIDYTIEEMRSESEKIVYDNNIIGLRLDGLKCPSCGKPVVLHEVNSRSCNVVGGDYRSQAICQDWIFCGVEIFSIVLIENLNQDILDNEHNR